MIADRLKLSDEQRAKVAALLAERRDALAKAAEADRPKVLEASEQKLSAVLSETQRAEFAQVPPEPLLRFRFRFQRWVDVLEEVARQAGLSLVLDAPPPGTLNYSDDKEYTPTEAIDLLNSVLVTKGFTLIRRDRMLVCINTEEGIPDNLVPQVTLDEVDHRGKFELVKVMFPLKGKAPAAVAEEIKPLMSPLGKVVPLPSTGQILVTDSAGNLKAIRALIETVPAPPAAAVAQPAKAEAPVFTIYPIKGIDPPSALSVLKTLYPPPASNFVLDPKTDQLSVHAGPTVQASVKAILEEMTKKGEPVEKQSRLELYPVDDARGAQTLKTLEGIAPKAQLTLDAKAGRVAAWATGAEHDLLKKALEKLGMGPLSGEARQYEVYRLTKADPKSVLAMLEALLPGARLTVDMPTNSLVAIASAAEHKAIKSLLEQLQPEKPGPETPELRFYQLTRMPTPGMATVIEGLAPKAKVTIDVANKRLMVVAPAHEQAAVKTAVEQFEKGAPEDKPRFENYLLHGSEPTALIANLQTIAPNAKFTVDPKSGKLSVWGTSADHEVVREAMKNLGRGTTIENTPQVENYRITRVDPSTLLPILQNLVPDAKVSVDATTKSLIVVAVPADQQMVRGVVKQFQSDKSGQDMPELRMYPITTADPTSVTAMLKSTFPAIQVTHDPKANRLMVWAFPSEHEALKKALEQIQAQVPAGQMPHFESYPLHGAEPTALVTNLQAMAPNAKITADAKLSRLIVWATPAEQTIVRGALEKLGRGTTVESTMQVETYRLTRVDPTTLVPLLQSLVPEAKVSVDAPTKTLVVVAVPADQQTVRGVVQQFQPQKAGRDSQERFEVYPVQGADPTTLVTQLQTLVPNAKLTADAKAARIVAWGTGADHDALKAALEKMVRGTTPDSTPQLQVYRLTKADPTTLTPLLQTLVPDAKISVDAQTKTLIAVAVQADHLTIKTVLEQLQPDKPAPDAPQLRFYPLSQPQPATVVTVLQGLAPKAQITLEPGGKRLTVVATPEDHRIVKAAIEQIQTVAVLDEKNKLVTYPVTAGQRKRFQAVATSLAAELPGIQIVPESAPDELAVWAKPTQHAVISQMLEQLKRDVPASEKYSLIAYPIKAADPQNVLTVMKTLFPNAQFVLDARTRRLIVWTLPADQDAIKAALEKVDSGTAAEGEDKLMVYPVPDIDPATAIKALQEQMPDVKFSTDAKSGAILAWARAKEHQAIARTLKQLKVEPDVDHKETLVVYPLPSGDATALSTLLKTLVPKAQVAVETKTNNIMATAVPKDHELIRAAVEQVSKRGPAGTMPEMVVHNLPSLGPGGAAALIPTLRLIFPDATFAAGADPTKLVVWAKPADQEPIRKAVEQMAKKESPETAQRVTTYPVEHLGPDGGAGILAILRSMFPEGGFGFDAGHTKMFVYARPDELPKIKNLVEEMTKDEPPETAHRLARFTIERHGPTGAAGVVPVLQTMFPGVLLTTTAEPGELVGWVRPEDEKKIREALKTLAAPETPDKARTMVVYTVESAGPGGVASTIGVLTTMFPEVKFTPGPEPHKFTAWARPAEHKKIQAAVDELAKKEPADKARKVVIYKIRSANASASYYTLSMLKTMFPDAHFSIGTENDQLVVWARPAQHVDIKATVEQIAAEESPEKAHKLVLYTFESTGAAGVAGAISLLTTMFPEARISAGSEPDKIAVWARPADHKRIEAAVKELSSKEPAEKAHQMVVYAIETTGAAGVSGALSILTTMFPEARFVAGTEPNKIVAWARPADHKKVAAAVAELCKKESPETARKVVVYPFKSADANASYYTLSALRTMFPDAQFSVGATPDKVAVWARAAEHEAIRRAIEELTQEDPPEKAHKLILYTFVPTGAAGVSGAISILTTMFPDAKFTPGSEPDKIAVWARPADHKRIEAAVKELSSKEPAEKAHQMVVYALEATGPYGASGAMSILTTMFPEAKFAAGTEPNKLVAWARPADQKKIATAVAELGKKEPPETARKMVVYPFKSADSSSSYYTLSALRTMFPDAQFSIGADPEKLAVWARPTDHTAIKSAVEQLSQEDSPEKARRMVVYTVEGTAGVSGAISILTTMFTDAKFSAGTEPDQVVAWARPAEQKKIAEAVAEFGKKAPPGKARKIVVYPFKSARPRSAYYTMAVLREMFPDAMFSIGAEPDKLVVWARPSEHDTIKSTIEQLSQEDPPERAFRLATYTLESAGRAGTAAAIDLLTSMFPEAHFTPGSEPGKVAAWARPDDQAKIKTAIEELGKKEPPDKAAQAAVYQLNSMAATAAIPFLTNAFPEAQFSRGAEPHALIVWARPADQKEIKATIEKLDVEGAEQLQRTVAVYPLKNGDVQSLIQLLEPMTQRNVQLVTDPIRRRLTVWADPKQQEQVRKAVEQFQKENAKIGEPTTLVYRFQWAEPQAAQSVLAALVPAAQIALDTTTHSLVATATPEDHAKIKAAIDEMDRRDEKGQAPRLQVHRVTTADPANLLTVLQGLFRTRSDVQLSLDEQNDTLVAVAPPAQHETIQNLIAQLEKETAADSAARLQLYPLKDADARATLRVLNELFEKQGAKVRLSLEPRDNQLVAIARPEQHAAIQKALEQIKGEERVLEIFTLEVIDPWTAEMAIGRLFSNGTGYFGSSYGPAVDVDPTSQQLFVRGTQEQLTKIRELLVKLGEPGLGTGTEGDARRSRTVSFDGDLPAALEEIQRVWPQLRKNPIHVMKPANDIPVQGREPKSQSKTAPVRIQPAAGPKPPLAQLPRNEAAVPSGDSGWRAVKQDARKTEGPSSPEARSATSREPSTADTGGWRASKQKGRAAQEGFPVVVIPGEGSVTITSDDPAALAQFEELLRSLTRQRGTVGRNFSVFLLRNAKAADVAQTLQRVFQSMASGWRSMSGPVVFVPDQRLNAIVAYASRADRTTIEGLIKVLDTAEVPESLAADRMHLIPVKNTSAARLERILADLFHGQVEGLSVEETTNSLVVMGSTPLVDEITRVVNTLDEAAGSDSSRSVTIVPLKKANSERVEKALDVILRSSSGHRRR